MTSPIHIQNTATDPALRAHQTLRAQHTLRQCGDELLAELTVKVELASDLQLPLALREEVRDRLIAFCASRLVRHRLATDHVLYSVAAGAAETRLLVRALRVQHDLLAALTRPPGAGRSEPATVPGPPRGSPTRTGRDTWPGTRAATASGRGC